MDKEDFNKLGMLEQINHVNKLLLNGESLRGISANLNMSKTTIRDRFKKLGYWFDIDKRQYVKECDQSIMKVLQEEYKEETVDLDKSDKVVKEKSPEKELERMFGTPKVGSNKSSTKVLQELPKEAYKSNAKVLQEFNSMKNDIMELIENKDEIFEMLKYYKSNANVIEIPQLDINNIPGELKGKVAQKSIKVYDGVYTIFDVLCADYPGIKKQDIISLALFEFYKKYKQY